MLPETVKTAIPPLHTQDPLPDEQLRVYARLTCEELGYTWLILELHKDEDTFSAYWTQPDKEQFGYFSFDDMHNKLPELLEYDDRFTPRLLVDAVQIERHALRLQRADFGLAATASLAEHRAYYYAARYDQAAPQVFSTICRILSEERPDLSVYQMLLEGYWYVIVIGDWPIERVHTRIMAALSAGTITIIPYELLLLLYTRKLEANQKGRWSEGHRSPVLKRKHKQKSRNKRKT